ncbi:MAG: taurine transporter, partial [Hyphomicrobiales bacterium]|nr:taurine transporter [Hyphomicrobiales bacterium]
APAGRTAPVMGGQASARAAFFLRIACAIFILALWEGLSRSGLFYGEVVPSLLSIVKAMGKLLADRVFWTNLKVTTLEVIASLVVGTALGVTTGIVLGANRFLMRAFEPYIYYLSPTPRIILFPIMIMWFGVGPSSKIALGALSAFFAVALSTAAGMHQIDQILIRVGRSFRASTWQMATKIFLPAMRIPVLNGIRLGLGTAIITVLLAETKLSNQGLGYLIMQIYTRFDMPTLYALLIIVFAIAGVCNALIGRATGERS